MNLSFDWYAGTPDISTSDFLDFIESNFPNTYLKVGSGRQGYTASERIFTYAHELLITVLHSQNSDCHFISTGDFADGVAPILRQMVPHRLSRADIAIDYLEGSFDELYKVGLLAAKLAGVKARLIAPPPELGDDGTGRTLYLGSRSSAGYVRIYEKGRQLKSEKHPNWVRVEYEFKPQNDKARYYYSTCEVVDMFSATKIGTELYKLLVGHPGSSRCRASQISDSEGYHATLRHLKKQYGNTLQRLLHDVDFDAQQFVNSLFD